MHVRYTAVFSLSRELVETSETLAWHAHAGRILAELERFARRNSRVNQRTPVDRKQGWLARPRPVNRRKQTTATRRVPRRGDDCDIIQPAPRSARQPSPTRAGAVRPATRVVWSPAPGIRRHPRVTGPGVIRPRAVAKRIPRSACKIRTPHVAAASGIHKASVVPHIA